VTCLDLGPWGAVYTDGWDRQVVLAGAEAKALKTRINTEWIYPPMGERAEILASADPLRIVVACERGEEYSGSALAQGRCSSEAAHGVRGLYFYFNATH